MQRQLPLLHLTRPIRTKTEIPVHRVVWQFKAALKDRARRMTNTNGGSPNASFLRSLKTFFSSRVLWAASLLLIGIITARILGPSDRGLYALFFTIVGIGSNLSNLGLSQANIYFINKKGESVGQLFSNTLTVFTAIIISYALLFYSLSDVMDAQLYEELLLIAVGLALVEIALSGFYYGQHFYRAQSALLVAQSLILLAATLAIFPLGGGLYEALILRIIGMFLFAALYFGVFWKLTKSFKFSFSLSLLKQQIRYGVRNWIQNLIGLINYRVYMLLLAYFSGSTAVGYFSIALLFVELVRFGPETIATLLFPKMSQSTKNQSANYVAISTRLTLLLMAVGAIGLIILVPWLLPIVFGEEYSQAQLSCQVLLLASVFGVVYQMLTRYFSSENQQQFSIYAGASALLVATSSSLLLIPEYALEGASIAYLLCSVFSCILMIYFFQKQTGVSARQLLIVQRSDLDHLLKRQ